MNLCKQFNLIFVIAFCAIIINDKIDAAAVNKYIIKKFNILEKRIQAAEWRALHMSAAAACQGLSHYGGRGEHPNQVLVKNPKITCDETCSSELGSKWKCNAHVSINGALDKATKYEQKVGAFYNYACNTNGYYFLEEVKSVKNFGGNKHIGNFFHYCCCKKPIEGFLK